MVSRGPKPKAPALSHFLCFPLTTATSRPQLSASLAAFKNDVAQSREAGGFDLPLPAVRPTGTLHLTLGMMSFPQDRGLDKAVEMLESLKPQEILANIKKRSILANTEDGTVVLDSKEPFQLPFTLRGLYCMRETEKATVLYASPSDPDGILQTFAERVKAAFEEAGLLAANSRPLLLHATIVNTIYMKGNRSSRKTWKQKAIRNAQAIMDRYDNHTWAEGLLLEKIAICKIGANLIKQDGIPLDAAYKVEAEISLE